MLILDAPGFDAVSHELHDGGALASRLAGLGSRLAGRLSLFPVQVDAGLGAGALLQRDVLAGLD